MCGVPHHAVETYLNRLVQKGYKVAIAEQMEDPKQAKGLVKREVIRVVTPGTILSDQALDETKNNYLMAVVYTGNNYGIATVDITTGDFFVTETGSERALLDEINKFSPSELICNEALYMSCLLYTSFLPVGAEGTYGAQGLCRGPKGPASPENDQSLPIRQGGCGRAGSRSL